MGCCLLSPIELIAANAEQRPKVAIIIDDLGSNWKLAQEVLSLSEAVSTSILPFMPYSTRIAKKAQQQKRSILLHAPMEAEHNNHLLGSGSLTSRMNPWEIILQLRKDIVSIPGVEGVNNHMGSLLTQNYSSMLWVMMLLKWQGLYFVDSRTTELSVAEKVATNLGLKHTRRNVFLDNILTEDAINFEFDRLEKLAKINGSAVAIAHPHPTTLLVLKKRIPLLKKKGIQLVSIGSLINNDSW